MIETVDEETVFEFKEIVFEFEETVQVEENVGDLEAASKEEEEDSPKGI